LEAGRFAPSGGNCQPWKFVVITNKEIIKEIDKAGTNAITQLYNAYLNDNTVKALEGMVKGPPPNVGGADPRIIFGGLGTVSKKGGLAPSLNAPAIILLLADERSIGNPQISIGICGQTMNLVANSLGIKATWSGFFAWGASVHPTLRKELGIEPPWFCPSSLCLGYPKFKQEGMVPRERRPVKWFREDKDKTAVPEKATIPQSEQQEA
ncbi:MAG: nitroreductase family protein, partial [Promethearchaeota archaeon]